jgi:hypothetical protein
MPSGVVSRRDGPHFLRGGAAIVDIDEGQVHSAMTTNSTPEINSLTIVSS